MRTDFASSACPPRGPASSPAPGGWPVNAGPIADGAPLLDARRPREEHPGPGAIRVRLEERGRGPHRRLPRLRVEERRVPPAGADRGRGWSSPARPGPPRRWRSTSSGSRPRGRRSRRPSAQRRPKASPRRSPPGCCRPPRRSTTARWRWTRPRRSSSRQVPGVRDRGGAGERGPVRVRRPGPDRPLPRGPPAGRGGVRQRLPRPRRRAGPRRGDQGADGPGAGDAGPPGDRCWPRPGWRPA